MTFSTNLVSLNIASNELTPKGVEVLTNNLLKNESLTSLNLSTMDGFQRNRTYHKGGQLLGNLLLNGRNVLQILNLSTTSLGNKGLECLLK